MLEADYQRALSTATDAAQRYLTAVGRGDDRKRLADFAMDARDLWAAVATVCSMAEDAARSRLVVPPLRHRRRALQRDWLERRNWAARGEDASARCQMAAALMKAHLAEPTNNSTTVRSLR
jgi:hypothetical protein